MALLLEKHEILSEPLHSLALQDALNNLYRELEGQSTDDPEVIDERIHSLPLLYCLHIEHINDQPDDFNLHYLRGWRYGDMIIDFAKKNHYPLYMAWQHLMQKRFQVLEADSASSLESEFIDLTTPEPRCKTGLTSGPSIIEITAPEPALLIDLSTPEPDQLVPALSLSARALAMARCCPPGLQLLTPDLRRYLLNRRPHPTPNLVTIGVAYYCMTRPERPYSQKWYYVLETLLLKVVMNGFARILGLEANLLYFRLYGHTIKPDDTVSGLGMEEGDIIEVENRWVV